jgi:excisionase family DNA binding protein
MASESKHPSVTLTRPEGSTPLPAFVVPRLLRIQDAARYLSATTWQVETLLREKTIPSLVLGKRRVIDRSELDRYVERRNAEAKAPSENDKDDQGCSSNAALTFSRTCSESVTPRQTWVVSREQRAKIAGSNLPLILPATAQSRGPLSPLPRAFVAMSLLLNAVEIRPTLVAFFQKQMFSVNGNRFGALHFGKDV